MKKIEWDLMKPQDIEVRPAMIKDGKATLLLYQNARNTMDALDRQFGEFGWKIEYKDVGGQTYGCLSILNEDTGEWICKEDTGDESNISAQKGQSSDILKRCAVRFGYGRELYTAPRVVVDDDGYGCGGYKVAYIDYNENREIIRLQIVNRFGKVVYDYCEDNHLNVPMKPVEQPSQPRKTPTTTNNNNPVLNGLISFCSSLKPTADKGELKRFYEFYSRKCNGWRGEMDYNNLWQRWCATAR